MKNRKLFFATLFISLCPVFLQAQAVQNDKGSAQDRTQIAADQGQLDRDTKELDQMRLLRARIVEAHEIGDLPSVKAIKEDILLAMKQELGQSEAKLAQANAEDRRERDQIVSLVERQSQIHQTFLEHDFVLDNKAQAKLNLVDEFILLMEEGKAIAVTELQVDRRERRDDRKEWKERN